MGTNSSRPLAFPAMVLWFLAKKLRLSPQDIFQLPMVLERETLQKQDIFSEEPKRKGKFQFLTSEIIGSGASPLSLH